MTDQLLSVENLTCLRGGLSVLEGVTFAVTPGQAMVLRGPNGSGKTTLLRTLAGLQPAAAGDITAAPESMAYAAHADGLKATLSVRENLAFWAQLFGRPFENSVLDRMDLRALERRPAQALSAGQKRRLGLARLLVTGRPIWLLDEPTVSLDAASVALFGDAIKAHLADGGAAVIATHIDLGFQAEVLDVTQFAPKDAPAGAFDEAFL